MARYSVNVTLAPKLIFVLLLKIHFIAQKKSVAPTTKVNKDSLPIAPMSSPTIAQSFRFARQPA